MQVIGHFMAKRNLYFIFSALSPVQKMFPRHCKDLKIMFKMLSALLTACTVHIFALKCMYSQISSRVYLCMSHVVYLLSVIILNYSTATASSNKCAVGKISCSNTIIFAALSAPGIVPSN